MVFAIYIFEWITNEYIFNLSRLLKMDSEDNCKLGKWSESFFLIKFLILTKKYSFEFNVLYEGSSGEQDDFTNKWFR